MTEKGNQQILILDPDTEFTVQLAQQIRANGYHLVFAAPTIRQAHHHQVRHDIDLAFIPISDNDSVIDALRIKQPDLRIVIMTPSPDFQVPESFSGKIQAILIKSHLEADLPDILDNAFHQPLVKEQPKHLKTCKQPDTALLIAVLQQANLGQLIQTAIFAKKERVLAHWGKLNDTEVAAVALHVGQNWPAENGKNVRVQFHRLPARSGDRLLYSLCVENIFLLTLVALPETPLTQLRIEADRIADHLAEAVHGRNMLDMPSNPSMHHKQKPLTYAIVWRPLKKLPPALAIPLRRALGRLATTNGCALKEASVQAELIHLVVTCPPGRDSAWAAYLFKNGSEAIIQQEYNFNVHLWETGYYATESEAPLSEKELNLFLEQPV
ncbi:MAG: hypothetical protein CSA11_04575 [Chloroflexi bacterium]|nr:MAG: hypothetical protein CSA11_04575 [Chloroflexota bacterium]